MLTEAEYVALAPSYDPGDLYEGMSSQELSQHLQVGAKARILRGLARRVRAWSGAEAPRLLDIGCGAGAFLLAGRDLGFDVTGVEPSEAHSALGRNNLGLDIKTCYFDPEAFAPESFQIVILSHVIEHIYHPRQFLTDAAALVAPGGVLWVATPNADSLPARLTGVDWTMLTTLDHVSMMSPAALRLIAPAGFASRIGTSEHMWEPALTMLLGVRNWRRRRGAHASPETDHTHRRYGDRSKQRGLSWFALSGALTIVSMPLFLANLAINGGACVVATFERPAR